MLWCRCVTSRQQPYLLHCCLMCHTRCSVDSCLGVSDQLNITHVPHWQSAAGASAEETLNLCLQVAGRLVPMTITLWNKIQAKMLPTPAKFHYLFNMRELSKVFQGIILATRDRCVYRMVAKTVQVPACWNPLQL